jgi:hypothetical protein
MRKGNFLLRILLFTSRMLSAALNDPQASVQMLAQTLLTAAESQRRHLEWHRGRIRQLIAVVERLNKICDALAPDLRVEVPPQFRASAGLRRAHSSSSEGVKECSLGQDPSPGRHSLQPPLEGPSACAAQDPISQLAASITPMAVRDISPLRITQLLPALALQLGAHNRLACRMRALLVVHEIISRHPSLAVPPALAGAVEACASDHRLLAYLSEQAVPVEPIMELHRFLCPQRAVNG